MMTGLTAVKGTEIKPMGLVLYARSGLGKTTFMGNAIKAAPNGILFQCGENGLADLDPRWTKDVPHYPNILGDYFEPKEGETPDSINALSAQEKAIRSWHFFKDDVLKFLMVGDHKFTHVGFDNFDNLINNNLDAYVVKQYYNNNLASANSYGGSKLREMYTELSMVIKAFEYLQKRGITVYVSTHAQATNFKDPSNPDYKKWSLSVPAREDNNLRTLLINWSSATLFGTQEVEVEKKKATGGQHVLKTKDDASWEAKCRYSIDESIDFSFDSFKEAVTKSLGGKMK